MGEGAAKGAGQGVPRVPRPVHAVLSLVDGWGIPVDEAGEAL